MSGATPAGPALPQAVMALVARLVRVFGPEQVVLFGSYARGLAGASSDVDLLVVLAREEDALELARRRQQLVAHCFPRIDLVASTVEELASAKGERAAFLRGVMQHGVVLHPAAPDGAVSAGRAPA